MLSGVELLNLCLKWRYFDLLSIFRINTLDLMIKVVCFIPLENATDGELCTSFRPLYLDLLEDDYCHENMLKCLSKAEEEPIPASLLLYMLMQPALVRKVRYRIGCGPFDLNDGFPLHDVCLKIARDEKIVVFCREVIANSSIYCEDVICYCIRITMSALRLGMEKGMCRMILRGCRLDKKDSIESEMIQIYTDLGACVHKMSVGHLHGIVDAFEIVRNVCNYGTNKRLNVDLYKKLKALPSCILFRDKLELLRPELGAGPYKIFRSWLRGNYSYAGGELGGKVSTTRGRSRPGSRCGAVNCTNIATFSCGGCIAVKYCSKICQVADWKAGHKEVCTSKRRIVSPSRSTESSCSGSDIAIEEFDSEGDSAWLAFILLSIVFGWLVHVCYILDD